jgi:tRNA dimethylallyltransferase
MWTMADRQDIIENKIIPSEGKYELITILGPTAGGKTTFAAALAKHLNTEIISADSRQVYRRMDIGTGKDLDDYTVAGIKIPYHLIDVCEPGTKYNVFRYQHDFFNIFHRLRKKGKVPILCGGTGMYIEAVLKGFKLLDVPPNPQLRDLLKEKSLPELEKILDSYKTLHNKTDVDSPQRAIRAIEIEEYYQNESPDKNEFEPINSLIIGIDIDREARRKKISDRLQCRLDGGMIDEVRKLIDSGIHPDDLIYYGLEYKYLTLYLTGKLAYEEMIRQLEIAIHQFAKRQMTWFRGMERRGFTIHWIEASISAEEKLARFAQIDNRFYDTINT